MIYRKSFYVGRILEISPKTQQRECFLFRRQGHRDVFIVLAFNDQGRNTIKNVSSKRIKSKLLTAQGKEVAMWKNNSNTVGKYAASILYFQNNPRDELSCSGG